MKKTSTSILDQLAAAAMLGTLSWGGGLRGIPTYYHTEKPMRKCALPSCNVMTNHNGGYCCAEHCREHNKK